MTDDFKRQITGGLDWLEQLVFGEFYEGRSLSVVVATMLVSFVPGVVLVICARDLTAVVTRLAKHPEKCESVDEWMLLVACVVPLALPILAAAVGAAAAGVGAVVGGIAGSELGAFLRAVCLLLIRKSSRRLEEVVGFLRIFIKGDILAGLRAIKFVRYEQAITTFLRDFVNGLIAVLRGVNRQLNQLPSYLLPAGLLKRLEDLQSAYYQLLMRIPTAVPKALIEADLRLQLMTVQPLPHSPRAASPGIEAPSVVPMSHKRDHRVRELLGQGLHSLPPPDPHLKTLGGSPKPNPMDPHGPAPAHAEAHGSGPMPRDIDSMTSSQLLEHFGPHAPDEMPVGAWAAKADDVPGQTYVKLYVKPWRLREDQYLIYHKRLLAEQRAEAIRQDPETFADCPEGVDPTRWLLDRLQGSAKPKPDPGSVEALIAAAEAEARAYDEVAKPLQLQANVAFAKNLHPETPRYPLHVVDADGVKFTPAMAKSRVWFYRPSFTLDEYRNIESGKTAYNGDITIGVEADQWLSAAQQFSKIRHTYYHERAHQYLTPMFMPLREFRISLRAQAYERIQLMRYIEEVVAEAVARYRMHGYSPLWFWDSFRFPFAHGYVSYRIVLTQAAGLAIGTVVVEGSTYWIYETLAEEAPPKPADKKLGASRVGPVVMPAAPAVSAATPTRSTNGPPWQPGRMNDE